ncbi:Flp pilus assembly protein CpaB [Cutibacterium acnes subsp. elongatum]
MNPRQRRGLIYLLIAVVVAIATFLTVTRYVASVNSQVGSRVTVYRAKTAISPYTPLSESVLEPVEVPRRWTSDSSMVSLSNLKGRRIGFRVEAGTVITRDMLIAPSDLNPDEREIAINVNSVTGVAGRVKPGDRVDIMRSSLMCLVYLNQCGFSPATFGSSRSLGK